MKIKTIIENKLKKEGITDYKLIYKKESKYQKRFKKEFREGEVWLYPKTGTKEVMVKDYKKMTIKKQRTFGTLITEEIVKDEEALDLIIELFKQEIC